MPKKSIEELRPNYSTVVDCLRQVIRNLDKTEFEPDTWEQDKSTLVELDMA